MVVKIKSLIFLALVQVFLLVNLTPANSYFLSSHTSFDSFFIEEKIENLISNTGKFLISLFSIKQIGSVSAVNMKVEEGRLIWDTNYETTNAAKASYSLSESVWNCCLKTKEGAICQDISTSDSEICENEQKISTSCEYTASCQIGCCYDSLEGTCTTKSTRAKCEESGGIFDDSDDCLIKECEKGCCVIGSNVEYLTERTCEIKTLGVWNKDFRPYKTELECIALRGYLKEGACIGEDSSCSFTTDSECAKISGTFYENYLCSNEELNSGCAKQVSTGCVEGKDEIYWFDSCGNRENIYSSNKDFSWNEGKVLEKKDSCNPSLANINSEDCGNCNQLLSSSCSSSKKENKISDGNYICKDLTCIDEKGNLRQNGESWCSFDGFIGEGKDLIGSRHWKRICVDGEIKLEPCADYRGQVCTEISVQKEGTDDYFSSASCTTNDALNCMGYNSEKDMIELCNNNAHCEIKNVNIDDEFQFNVCVGKYPRGFDLTYSSGTETSKELCAMANQECTVIYEYKISGKECIANCDCEKKEFTEKMNDLCISLGDCGSYVNIAGKGDDAYQVENAPKIYSEEYLNYLIPVAGQFVPSKSIETLIEQMGIGAVENSATTSGFIATALDYINTVQGYAGYVLTAAGWISTTTSYEGVSFVSLSQDLTFSLSPQATTTTTSSILETTVVASEQQIPFLAAGDQGIPFRSEVFTKTTPTLLGNIATVISSIGIGMMVATIANYVFGLQGDAAVATMATGAVVGGIAGSAAGGMLGSSMAGIATFSGIGGGLGSGGLGLYGAWLTGFAAGIWAVIFVVAVAIIMKVLKIGEIEEVKVKFECLPWQAPFGSDDCSKCNENSLKPCSEYRCSSLGLACGLLNENSENPQCAPIYFNDGKNPELTNFQTNEDYIISKINDSNYEYALKRKNGECLPEFNLALFGFETDKHAQCKFDLVRKESYSEMDNYLAEGNLFVTNHTGGILLPSISSLSVYDVNGTIINKTGNLDLFIRCVDIFGNYNKKEYSINFCLNNGPDETPATIIKTNPVNGAIMKKGVSGINASFYLIEPAECKCDYIDRDYGTMKYSMNCKTELTDMTKNGWECNMLLLNLTREENNLYIKCKDQPWYKGTENESLRNENKETYIYTIYSSTENLKIDSVSPSGKFESGLEPFGIKLEIKTSGGVNNGISKCSYSFKENSQFYTLFSTYKNTHYQNFNLFSGTYKINVYCEDDAGNNATGKTEFELKLDNEPPIVTRIYGQGQTIYLLTNEDARCYYSEISCQFDLENGTAISTGYSSEHSIVNPTLKNYYVRCEDKWNNYNTECATIVRPEL